jgi:hypothetical protein
VLNRCREKRLLDALHRYTSQKVSANKKQTRQEWNFDLHDDSPQFLPLNESSWQGLCQTPAMLQSRKNAGIRKFSDSAVCLARVVTKESAEFSARAEILA